MTEFTRTALTAWQTSRGLPVTGDADPATLATIGNPEGYFTTHSVSQEEIDSLTAVPESWLARSRMERLGYETILELVAEKYHATEQLILELNPAVAWPHLPAGTFLRVPNPRPNRHPPVKRIEIEMSRNQLRGYDTEGRQVLLFPVSIAEEVAKRPEGDLRIVNAAEPPNYTADPAVLTEYEELQSLGKKLLIPPGPNNPVGLGWLGLNQPGYGIHGSPSPEEIGITRSHGCFRLANWNITKLMKMVTIGTPVVVMP